MCPGSPITPHNLREHGKGHHYLDQRTYIKGEGGISSLYLRKLGQLYFNKIA